MRLYWQLVKMIALQILCGFFAVGSLAGAVWFQAQAPALILSALAFAAMAVVGRWKGRMSLVAASSLPAALVAIHLWLSAQGWPAVSWVDVATKLVVVGGLCLAWFVAGSNSGRGS